MVSPWYTEHNPDVLNTHYTGCVQYWTIKAELLKSPSVWVKFSLGPVYTNTFSSKTISISMKTQRLYCIYASFSHCFHVVLFGDCFCWFHGSSFKGYSIVFPAPWLAKVELSQKSNGMWFLRHFFAPYLFHRSENNRRDKLRSKFWREKMFRKPHWSCWHDSRSMEPTIFKRYRFQSFSYRCKVKTQRNVCSFDENDMKTHSCRRGLRLF